jgi:hypothetical protein
VSDLAASQGIVVVLCAGTYLVVMRFMRRRGYTTPRDLPPNKRRLLWLGLALALLVTLVCAWAFATGHPAIGIGVLVAFSILPEFVLVPIRFRRSRRRRGRPPQRRTGTDTR